MICAILLAGGEGRRFGGDKLSARLPDGRPVALAAAAAVASAAEQHIVVTRPGRDALIHMLTAHGWTPVTTTATARGKGASLAAGIQASREATGWLVALADMPLLQPATAQVVANALRTGALAAAPFYRGQRGHPVGFSAQLAPQLLALDGDTGARAVLQTIGSRLLRIDVEDPGVLLDIDQPEDLARYCQMAGGVATTETQRPRRER